MIPHTKNGMANLLLKLDSIQRHGAMPFDEMESQSLPPKDWAGRCWDRMIRARAIRLSAL
jgi:hypothetical protein